MDPMTLTKIRFAVREATAFVGHSFSEDDRDIVEQLKAFLTKLGIQCDSGTRPEPKGISAKVLERIRAAELFVGIFTRRDALADGSFTTSPWVVEEKATAITEGKKLLLFVEEGVREFGGLQGDYEYIRFSRDDLARALIHAMEYVLAITSVPLQCRHEPPNKLHFQIGPPTTPDLQLTEARKLKLSQPKNPAIRIHLAKLLEHTGDRLGAINELRQTIQEFPAFAEAYHEFGHTLERHGQLSEAVMQFQEALDRAPHEAKNFRCYGRCLYQRAREITEPKAKNTTLQKAGRLLQQAYTMSPEQQRPQIERDIFLIEEALQELGDGDQGTSAGAA